jgi:hypothetical protein
MQILGGYQRNHLQLLEHPSAAEISIGSVITLLKPWASFDTQNGQPA